MMAGNQRPSRRELHIQRDSSAGSNKRKMLEPQLHDRAPKRLSLMVLGGTTSVPRCVNCYFEPYQNMLQIKHTMSLTSYILLDKVTFLRFSMKILFHITQKHIKRR